MERVKLPREVAEAIESVRSHYKSGCEYDLDLMSKETYGGTKVINDFTQKSRETMVLYFKALVNGYEVEQTPEDHVRELFRVEKENDANGSKTAAWILTGALRVLGAYNIKIEGVND